MTLEEIKKFLEENKEDEQVKAYLQGLQGDNQVTVDSVQSLVKDNEDFKKWFDSERDKHFNKSLETWKSNHLQKLIDDEIKQRYPEETEEQRKFKELEQQIKRLEGEKTRESLSKKALEFASNNNLPTGLIDLFVADDEEKTNEYLKKFQESWNTQVQKVKEQLVKDNGIDLKDSQKNNTFTKEQINSMSTDEINKNWDLIKDQL